MAPSQRTNPNLSRFFSTTALATLVQSFEAIFHHLGVVLAPTVTDGVEARVRFRHRDKRGEKLSGQIKITPSVLPAEDASQRMNDGGEETEDGTQGYDVVCFKKEADPLEMRRLWTEVLKALPPGIIYSR